MATAHCVRWGGLYVNVDRLFMKRPLERRGLISDICGMALIFDPMTLAYGLIPDLFRCVMFIVNY